jgi:hypothetical protein
MEELTTLLGMEQVEAAEKARAAAAALAEMPLLVTEEV